MSDHYPVELDCERAGNYQYVKNILEISNASCGTEKVLPEAFLLQFMKYSDTIREMTFLGELY